MMQHTCSAHTCTDSCHVIKFRVTYECTVKQKHMHSLCATSSHNHALCVQRGPS
jgi:hypothetical protein